MSKKSTLQTFDDEAPLTQADITGGKLVLRKRGTTGKVQSNKQRVSIYLDTAVLDHFKAKAGERGYQTMINEALKQSLLTDSIEATIRKTIRAELRKS